MAIKPDFQPLPVLWDQCQHYKALENFYGLKLEWYRTQKKLQLMSLNEDESLMLRQKLLELENCIKNMQRNDDNRLNWLKYQEPHIQNLFNKN